MLVLFFILILLLGIIFSEVEIKIINLEIILKEENIFEALLKLSNTKIIKKINIKFIFKIYGVIKFFYIQIYKDNQKYFIILNLFGIKINLKSKANRKIFKRMIDITKYIEKLNMVHSDTNLNINFGTENIFITSMLIPIISNIVIAIFTKNANGKIPTIYVSPIYNRNFNLEIYFKSNLKVYTCKLLKTLNIFLKERKNNIKQYKKGEKYE